MTDTSPTKSAVVWFEIPAASFDRTVGFYETVLETTLRREAIGGSRLAVFPYQRPGVGGAVIEAAAPSQGGSGPLVYLDCGDRLDAVAGRVEAAGGRLAGPRIDLPPGMGSFIHVVDPDGNRVGLHGA
jgi:hypothetical protein